MSASMPRRGYGYRKDHPDPTSTSTTIVQGLAPMARRAQARLMRLATSSAERERVLHRGWTALRRFFPWPPIAELLLIFLWISSLNWGERTAFGDAVAQCSWSRWEAWPADATPYHIALIADPQLVDPHTYPGRPWPLSTLTIKHTDQYLRRSFATILDALHPASVLFLGDLFDGGREWSTGNSQSPEQRYRKYNDKYWLKEYRRFGRIFVDPWLSETAVYGDAESRFEASMPGNHDLGIANGVQIPVRERFASHFGEVNHIQVLGNHTFVSVDSVSLSAKGAQDDHPDIWGPTDRFLTDAKRKKAEIVARELRTRARKPENTLLKHVVVETDEYKNETKAHGPEPDPGIDLPTILLTHVPLYREPGTPCGPLREKYPPSKSSGSGEPMTSDDANSIKVQGGYQYQNVLHPQITDELVNKIGGIEHVFSGDDHDYCEVVHSRYPSKGGGIREITVKSLSWAMGVRHPGFVLLSLWNPLSSATGKPLTRLADGSIQSHLCLLPDQLSIFLYYLKLLVLTAVVLAANAAFFTLRARSGASSYSNGSLLPIDEPGAFALGQLDGSAERHSVSGSSSSNSSEGVGTSLRASVGVSRPRVSPTTSGPSSTYQYHKDDKPGYAYGVSNGAPKSSTAIRFTSRRRMFLTHFGKSLRLVAIVGFMWYVRLMRNV